MDNSPKVNQSFVECPLCVGCGKVRPYEAEGILNAVNPPKESPVVDKPAEGLARVELMGYEASVMIGKFRVCGFDSSYEGCDPIQLAHERCVELNMQIDSIVKPLREKADALDNAMKVLDRYERTFDSIQESLSTVTKDRDAWKENALGLNLALDLALTYARPCVEATHFTDGFRPRKNQADEDLELIKGALAGHEALKGKT